MKRALAWILTGLFTSATFAETITVAAAISLKDALAEIAEQYEKDTGERVEFIHGSSGQLAGQIQNGAPVDLFISAADAQVELLAKAGLIDVAGRKVIAGNTLVLIVPSSSLLKAESVKALTDSAFSRIAIGEPKSVPAGQYAIQAMQHAGVAEQVKDRLIFGTNVRQVLDYVERGEVTVGLVYATDAKISGDKVRVTGVVGETEHDPIVYPAVRIIASKKQSASERFLDRILSDNGQATLRKFGFNPPPQPTAPPKR